MSSAYFAGKTFRAPGSASQVTIAPVLPQQPTTALTVGVIGRSTGGPARAITSVRSYNEARDVFRSGTLVDLFKYLYNPATNQPGAYRAEVYRLNNAVKATATVKDSTPATVITLTARDAGLHTNQIRYKVEAGTSTGYKASLQGYDNSLVSSQDNIARPMLIIDYKGAGSAASLTITASQLAITVTGGAAGETVTLPFASYTTLQSIADALISTAGYDVTVVGNAKALAATLDLVSAQSVMSATTISANTQAVIDWFNQSEYVTATRATGAAIAAMSAFESLTGGSDGGSITTSDYQTALTALQAVDCNIVIVDTDDATVHAMVDEHCRLMSAVGGNKERIAILGGAAGETPTAVAARARLINSERAALCYPGFTDTDESGATVTRSPVYTAAAVAGIAAGLTVGQPATRKPIRCIGVERALTPTEIDNLLSAGVLPIVNNSLEGAWIVQSLLTYAPDSSVTISPISQEISARLAADVVVARVRSAVDARLIGTAGGPLTLEQAKAVTESALQVAETEGILVGDAQSPAYGAISAELSSGVVNVAFQARVPSAINYVFLTASLSTY